MPGDGWETTKRFLMIFIYIFLGFCLAHWILMILFVLFQLMSGGTTFLGVPLEVPAGVFSANLIEALRAHLLWLPGLGVLVAGSATLLLSWGGAGNFSGVRWLISGAGLYATLNLLLVLALPGVLAHAPFFRKLPFFVDLTLVCAVLLWVWVGILPGTPRGRISLLVIFMSMLTVPHDAFRRWRGKHGGQVPQNATGGLIFVIDAANYDTVHSVLKRSAPGSILSLRRGVSHFGNTRKQYKLLVSGDPDKNRELFVFPVEGEKNDERRIDKKLNKALVLLDDGGTLNKGAVPEFPGEIRHAPSGLKYYFQAPRFCPIIGVLQNMLSSVETSNPVSSFDAFLRDGVRCLGQSPLVIIHTTRPQRSLYSWAEMTMAGGHRWLAWRPIEIGQPGGVCPPEKVYELQVDQTIKKVLSWMTVQCGARPGMSGLITSDHGQSFRSAIRQGLPVQGHHGFFFEADTVWIPFLPIGKTKIGPPSNLYSWLDLHPYLICGIPMDGMDLVGSSETLNAETTFLLHPAEQFRKKTYPDNVLDVSTFVKHFKINPDIGIQVSPSLLEAGFKRSRLVATPPDRLMVENPAHGAKGLQVDYFAGPSLLQGSHQSP